MWMGRQKPDNPPVIYCACPMPIKGLGFFVVDGKGKTRETPSYLLCLPHAHKGARTLCCGWEGENPRTPQLFIVLAPCP